MYPDGEGPGQKDWRKGVYLIKVAKEKGYKIDKATLSSILNLKNSINSLRTNSEGYTLTSDMVNKYWLLGARSDIEGQRSRGHLD